VDDPPDFVFSGQFQTDWQGSSSSNIAPQESVPLPSRLNVRDLTALQFDGVDDYVAISGWSYTSARSQLGFELWFYSFGEDGILWSYDRSEYWRLEIGGDSAPSGDVGVSFLTDSGQVGNFNAGIDAVDGRWHHVAFMYDGGTATLYIDGEQVNTTSSGSQIGSGNTRFGFFGVGSEADTYNGSKAPTDYFNGRLSEARLWDGVVRTQTEIQDNLYHTLGGDESGLVGYWRMQDTSTISDANRNLPDKSANGNDGEIFGCIRHSPTIRAIIPTSDLSRDELSSMGYDTRDQLITAGYDYRAQPTPSTAQFVEVYDAGAVIASTSIRVTLAETDIVGSVDSTITISTKENIGDAWNDQPVGQNPVFATSFRFVKVTVDYSISDDTSFMSSSDIRTTLSSKIISDSGTVDVQSNPTTVPFSTNFVDVTGITATPQGTTSKIAVVDFNDVANPTGFDLYLFDGNGSAATGQVRWQARGF